MEFKPFHIKGGSQALSNAILNKFLLSGGTARFNCGAKKIIVNQGRINGVVTDHDDEIKTDYVVSNVSPVATYNYLMDTAQVPADARAEMKGRNLSTSAFTLFIGFDCEPDQLGITETTNFLMSTTDISNALLDRMNRPDIGDDFMLLSCYDVSDPQFSPSGTCQASVVALKYGEPWLRIPPRRYHDVKFRCAESMLKRVQEIYPRVRDHIEEIEVSRKLGGSVSSAVIPAEEYIRQLHPDRLELCVSDIIEETPSTKTFRLVSKDNYLPPFLAGQYIALYLEIAGIRTSRPYSISSQPNQAGFYDIPVRRVENGLVSNCLLDELRRGDTLIASGPAGNFYFNPLVHKQTMVCIAGGSGITPFMSMIREIIECGHNRTIYVYYGNPTTDDIIFGAELDRLSKRFDNVHYVPVIEEPSSDYQGACGFITRDVMREVLENIEDKSFFICGPQGLYDFCLPQLEEMGIPRRKIKQEMYGAPPNIWQYPGWPQEIQKDDLFTINIKNGKQLKARAGEPLLVALEKNGVVVPSLCRSGECSMCRLKIISGKVFQTAGVPVRKSDKKYGYVHSCVSYPLEDLEVLIV